MIAFLALLACTDDTNDTFANQSTNEQTDTANEDSSDTDSVESIPDLNATQQFRVPQRPWDVIEGPDGTIYCSAQGGNKVYLWDPVLEERIEYPHSVPDVQNLYVDDQSILYFTRTEYGVTGNLSRMNGSQAEVLYSQADDGFLMRWPMDVVRLPNDEGWVIADFGSGVLFVVDAQDSVTTRSAGSAKPQGLLLVEDVLYVSGEDGVYRIEWPDGEAELIDERAGLALLDVDGVLWSSNADLGIFEVGGEAVGLNQAARPGSLLKTSDGIYFADHVGEGVWLYQP